VTRNIFSRQFVVSIFLLVFCFLSVSQVHVEGGRLTEDEQNTIEIFKKASRGVVHINVRVTKESQFEKNVYRQGQKIEIPLKLIKMQMQF